VPQIRREAKTKTDEEDGIEEAKKSIYSEEETQFKKWYSGKSLSHKEKKEVDDS